MNGCSRLRCRPRRGPSTECRWRERRSSGPCRVWRPNRCAQWRQTTLHRCCERSGISGCSEICTSCVACNRCMWEVALRRCGVVHVVIAASHRKQAEGHVEGGWLSRGLVDTGHRFSLFPSGLEQHRARAIATMTTTIAPLLRRSKSTRQATKRKALDVGLSRELTTRMRLRT